MSVLTARRAASDWPAVERAAHAILGIDPFNEEATLALAEATALSGGKREALSILLRYENETGRADLRLPASVLRRRISERVPDSRRRPLETPFVGRDTEAAAMRRAVVQSREGAPGSIVIAGEPGIGKSRLLEETSALAALEGVSIHVVRCQPHYGSRPMGVFIDLVPSLLASRGALGASPESLERLSLLTSHRDDRPNRPADARDDATRSGTLLAALRDLIDAVASESPLLVAVEDAHWADPTSLTELSALVHGATGRALLVAYTTREVEPLRKAGAIADATPVLRLKPLVESSMAFLARHLLPVGLDDRARDEVASWFVHTASGNPLFLQMLCAHYDETRQPFAVPPSILSATTRRIEQLPGECRRFLELCALLGQHATLEALRSLVELTPSQFVDAVRRLEEEGYLRTDGSDVRVSHDLLRECTLSLVAPLTRKALHGMVAPKLEQRYEETQDAALLWDCAEHWAASGETGKALQFVMRCARHAADIGRAAKALELLDGAKRFARSPTETANLLRETIFAARTLGRWVLVSELVGQLMRADDAESPMFHTEIELVAHEARWAARLEVGSAARNLLDCTRCAGPHDAHRVDAALLLVRMAHELCDPALAHRAFVEVEQFVEHGSARYADRILPLIYHTSFGDRDVALALAHGLRRDLGAFDILHQFRGATNVGLALCTLGATEEGIEVFDSFYQKAVALDLLFWRADLANSYCWAHIAVEEFEAAGEWNEIVADLGNQDGDRGLLYDYRHLSHGVELALWKGSADEAQAHLDALISMVRVSDSSRLRAYIKSLEIRLAQLDANFRCDDDVIGELGRLLETTKALASADSLATAYGEALKRRGRLEELRIMLDDYLRTSRRERTPVPAALRGLVA